MSDSPLCAQVVASGLPPLDLSGLPPPLRKALDPAAPAPLRQMAAKGVAPGAKPGHVLTALCALAQGPDVALAQTATQTLSSLPTPMLTTALREGLQAAVQRWVAAHTGQQPDVVQALLTAPGVPSEALEIVAQNATEAIGELVAASDNTLLKFPRVIEKLYLNRRVRMSTADRLVDLAVRNHLELNIPSFKQAAEAISEELIQEPTDEPSYDDQLFQRAEQLAAGIDLANEEDTHEIDDEGVEQVAEKFKPLYAQISDMTTSQKIRRATLGKPAERMLLVRDNNRLVATAAAQSPLLNENEAARIAASRNVIDDVLRIIAMNKDFTRNYQVKLNLVGNPRTPFSFASRLVPLLRDNDLRTLSRSKNVAAAVQTAARQQLLRKQRQG